LDPLLHQPASTPGPQTELTLRQREVLQLVAEGRTLKEIASILCLSVKTVEFHKTQLAKQLGLHTTADLTKYAVSHGLVSL
jgi:DNA-binding NarL/FixJ family response regulator